MQERGWAGSVVLVAQQLLGERWEEQGRALVAKMFERVVAQIQ